MLLTDGNLVREARIRWLSEGKVGGKRKEGKERKGTRKNTSGETKAELEKYKNDE